MTRRNARRATRTVSFGPEKIPLPMLRAIGLFIVAASTAEYHLGDAILRLLSEPGKPVGHAYPLVAGLEAKTRINLVRIFVQMFDLKDAWSIHKILDEMGSLFDRRNEIAHSVMIRNPKKPGQIRFQDLRAKVRLGEMPQPQVRTAAEITKCAGKLLRLCSELGEALSMRGQFTMSELHAIEIAKLSPEALAKY
jgi:hypothetical protein